MLKQDSIIIKSIKGKKYFFLCILTKFSKIKKHENIDFLMKKEFLKQYFFLNLKKNIFLNI